MRAPVQRRRRRRTGARDAGTLPGMRGTRREYLGTPANVPDVWARRMLRLEPAPARQRALPQDRPSRHALRRARRELAVVLCRHSVGLNVWLNVWQGVFAMTEPTDRPTVLLLVTPGSGRDLALAFTRLGAAVSIVGQ